MLQLFSLSPQAAAAIWHAYLTACDERERMIISQTNWLSPPTQKESPGVRIVVMSRGEWGMHGTLSKPKLGLRECWLVDRGRFFALIMLKVFIWILWIDSNFGGSKFRGKKTKRINRYFQGHRKFLAVWTLPYYIFIYCTIDLEEELVCENNFYITTFLSQHH